MDPRPPNKAPEPGDRAAVQDGQRKARKRSKRDKTNRRPNFWPYIAGGFSLFIIIGILYFKSEIVKVYDSQQKKLQNQVEGCKANLNETHGEVHELNLANVAASGTIDCLQNKVEVCETRLSEKTGEYDHLQDEFRKEKEKLEQKNQAQTETIEAKREEVDDMKAKLSDMQNERDRAKDDYGKEKQENEKCKSDLQKEIEGCRTRLSEKVGEYKHLQNEYRKEKEQLEQKNQAKTETIEAKTREIDDLKAKLSEMQNERDHAKDDYGKEKQENEKCRSKLHSESKMVQDQQRTINDLNVKFQNAEKRFHDQKKEESVNWGNIAFWVIGFVLFACMCIASCGNNSK